MIEIIANYTFLGNPASAYLKAGLLLIAGILLIALLRNTLGRKLRRKGEEPDAGGRWWVAHLSFRRVVVPLLYIGTVWIAISGLALGDATTRILRGIIAAVGAIIAVRAILFMLDTSLKKYAQKTGREEDEKRAKPLLSLISFLLWMVAFIFLLDNFGFNISTLVAGIGVSGIAIAIAAQGILGDLFNYFVIFFDRPFELGDFLIFDDILGTVEHIGLKTTHIRSLGGELIVVSNSVLTGSRLRNYKHMAERRVVFSFGVTYDTGGERLREIPGVVRSIIETEEQARFDRAHFKAYGASSLDFEVVYYVLSPDYNLYMDVQQRINLAIYEAFEEQNIEFAFPT